MLAQQPLNIGVVIQLTLTDELISLFVKQSSKVKTFTLMLLLLILGFISHLFWCSVTFLRLGEVELCRKTNSQPQAAILAANLPLLSAVC